MDSEARWSKKSDESLLGYKRRTMVSLLLQSINRVVFSCIVGAKTELNICMKIKFPFSSGNYQLITYTPAVLAGLVLLVLGVFVDYLNWSEKEATQRQLVHDQLSTLRAQLEGHINSNIHLVQGLVAVIAEEPELTQKRFSDVARHLFGTHSKLRNLAAAPDLVIRHMYPVEGNEAAIGLDFRKHPDQYDAVRQVVELGKPVLAGPVNLVQGGHGFIMRVPVYTEHAQNGNRFWGVVSAVIDMDMLYHGSGLLHDELGIAIAIRGDNATGEHGQIFFDERKFSLQILYCLMSRYPMDHGRWRPCQNRAGRRIIGKVFFCSGPVCLRSVL